MLLAVVFLFGRLLPMGVRLRVVLRVVIAVAAVLFALSSGVVIRYCWNGCWNNHCSCCTRCWVGCSKIRVVGSSGVWVWCLGGWVVSPHTCSMDGGPRSVVFVEYAGVAPRGAGASSGRVNDKSYMSYAVR